MNKVTAIIGLGIGVLYIGYYGIKVSAFVVDTIKEVKIKKEQQVQEKIDNSEIIETTMEILDE